VGAGGGGGGGRIRRGSVNGGGLKLEGGGELSEERLGRRRGRGRGGGDEKVEGEAGCVEEGEGEEGQG